MSTWNKKLLLAAAGLLMSACLAAGCAPQAAKSESKTAASSSEGFIWTADGDCATCHALEANSFDDASCLASTHENNECSACHTDVATLETTHEGATAEKAAKTKRLHDTVMDGKACFACHGSNEALAEKTAASTVLTDPNGKVVNPHAMPSNTSHDETQCSDCHTMHKEASLEETAQKFCISCHHGGTYECYTCHQ